MSDEINVIKLTDADYPPLLKEIADPPTKIYIRGNHKILSHQPLVAVVGSRKASFYGRQVINKIFPPLTQLKIPLVSGLAYGIDSLAHKVCVEHGAPTIAVLGTGLNDAAIYPSKHTSLAHQIIENGGALVSEYPDGTPPRQHHFPERNRIISGLSAATIIVQAAMRSGSLITARLALENGRDVSAVPGYITDPLSAGTNHLIQQGAAPILDAQDVLDLLNLHVSTSTDAPNLKPNLSKTQQSVIKTLSSTPLHVDKISAITKISTPTLSVTLTELELLNVVQHTGGMKYVRK